MLKIYIYIDIYVYLHIKLDGALLITDPPAHSSTTLSEKQKQKNYTWQLTTDMWQMTCDMWHMMGFKHSLKIWAP